MELTAASHLHLDEIAFDESPFLDLQTLEISDHASARFALHLQLFSA